MEPSPNFVEAVACRAQRTTFDALPGPVLHWAKVSIIDTFGVMLAGSVSAGVDVLEAAACASDGACLVFSSGRRRGALEAALVNGMAAHVLDFDTSSDTFSGHPSVHLLPALFALAEDIDADGRQLLTAYVAGFEAQSRIARSVNPRHFEKGWFMSGTVGVFGATAGAAHLLGLNESQAATALSIASMMASGSTGHAGTMTKPLGAGQAARNGILAARLARSGFTAAEDGLGDRRGFFRLYNDAGPFHADPILIDQDIGYDIIETAMGIKQYPCCGRFHSSVDLLSAIVGDNALVPADILRIDAKLTTTRLSHFDRPQPASAMEAKFSIQYCLACTVKHGRPRLNDFTASDQLQDPEIVGLMAKVNAYVDPEMPTDIARHEEGGAVLSVTTVDGRVFSQRATKPAGRVPGHPLSDAKVDDKFIDCATTAMSEVGAAMLLATLRQLESVKSVAALGQDLSRGLLDRPNIEPGRTA